MTRCFIALGSNLEQPLQQVKTAIQELSDLPASSLLHYSHWYQSSAVGPGEQADYINGVAELHSSLQPLALLDALQAIEHAHQRKKLERWGPRTLDLDLLFYGDQCINEPRLSVPHPSILERNFVLLPLAEIAPAWVLPNQLTVSQHLQQHPQEKLRLVD